MYNILRSILIVYATGIFVGTENTFPEYHGTHDENFNLHPTVNEEEFTNNTCNREIQRRQPDFSKATRVSERQCEIYKSEMYYRDDLEKNNMECYGVGIVGGRDALIGEFPHMGAVGWKADTGEWLFKCGGSLISKNFVLSAAHCTRVPDRDTTITIDANRSPKIVRLGQINIREETLGLPRVDVNIFSIHIHPFYKSPKRYNDIALFRLEKEVEFTKYIQPACLWTKFNTTSLGNEGIVTGWGVLKPNALETSAVLQAATIEILESTKCNELLTWCTLKFCGMQDNQLCAGKLDGGVDSCQGDSGGPLQVKIPMPITTQGTLSYIIGVISFGNGCGFVNTPGVYARVSYAIDWIESVVWPLT